MSIADEDLTGGLSAQHSFNRVLADSLWYYFERPAPKPGCTVAPEEPGRSNLAASQTLRSLTSPTRLRAIDSNSDVPYYVSTGPELLGNDCPASDTPTKQHLSENNLPPASSISNATLCEGRSSATPFFTSYNGRLLPSPIFFSRNSERKMSST